MTSRDERDAQAHFAERYALPVTAAANAIELRVIGAVWGANGFTTLAEADELAIRLDLRPGDRLLDIGTGRGWPGLYLAKRAECFVAGTDLPPGALVAAGRRAEQREIDAAMVGASAGALPFRPASFDGVVHTDVLC